MKKLHTNNIAIDEKNIPRKTRMDYISDQVNSKVEHTLFQGGGHESNNNTDMEDLSYICKNEQIEENREKIFQYFIDVFRPNAIDTRQLEMKIFLGHFYDCVKFDTVKYLVEDIGFTLQEVLEKHFFLSLSHMEKGLLLFTKEQWNITNDEIRENTFPHHFTHLQIAKILDLSRDEVEIYRTILIQLPVNLAEYLIKQGMNKAQIFEQFYDWIDGCILENLISLNLDADEFQAFIQHEQYRYLLQLGIPKNIWSIKDSDNIEFDDFLQFLLKKIIPSNLRMRIFFNRKIPTSKNLQEVLKFLFLTRKKSMVNFWQVILINYTFNFQIPDPDFITLIQILNEDRFDDIPAFLQQYHINDTVIQQALNRKQKTELYKKIGSKILDHYMDQYHQKWEEQLHTTLLVDNVQKDKIYDPLFIEAFKICFSPLYNQEQGRYLLKQYLQGDFDDTSQVRQFNTINNQQWLKTLSKQQQEIWLSNNINTIDISNKRKFQHSNTSQNKEQAKNDVQHIASRIIHNIHLLNQAGYDFQKDFLHLGDMITYFNRHIRSHIFEQDESALQQKISNDIERLVCITQQYDIDIGLQSKLGPTKIIIEKELNPLRVLMMGNWVQGSCLSFYSYMDYYYSAIANAVDANKGVFYIYADNEKQNLLARVLVAIDDKKRIVRFPMYYATDIDFSLDSYFDEYLQELSHRMGMEISAENCKIQTIESTTWYTDVIEFIDE